jgi:hypothetical protein
MSTSEAAIGDGAMDVHENNACVHERDVIFMHTHAMNGMTQGPDSHRRLCHIPQTASGANQALT